MTEASAERIAAVRRFGRFYTRHVGALNEGLLQSTFPLTEARVIYELANRQRPTASDLARELRLDPGYLSRLLRNFRERGLVEATPSPTDARQNLLGLTEQGRAAFETLDRSSRDEVARVLESLSEADQERLVEAMRTIETLLANEPPPPRPYLLRPHRPGDIGWVVHRHAVLYAREYGWDQSFEAMVAEIGARFIRDFDAARECCWLAERDGEILGSAFLVRDDDARAKLRLVYVEPEARGAGVGTRLVEECIRFARAAGYRSVTLWTNDILHAARRVYERLGFRLVERESHHSFGHDLVGENWELVL
ncbi:MAG: MarR family transcriptional regulator [Chromatiales bacterium]|nr:MarR family transcriptional regulator [Chromatiales bacterium]